MRFEVTWQYWDEEEEEQVFQSKQYANIAAATDRLENMKRLPHIEYARIAVIIEEFSRTNVETIKKKLPNPPRPDFPELQPMTANERYKAINKDRKEVFDEWGNELILRGKKK